MPENTLSNNQILFDSNENDADESQELSLPSETR